MYVIQSRSWCQFHTTEACVLTTFLLHPRLLLLLLVLLLLVVHAPRPFHPTHRAILFIHVYATLRSVNPTPSTKLVWCCDCRCRHVIQTSTRGPGRKPGASVYTRKRLSLSLIQTSVDCFLRFLAVRSSGSAALTLSISAGMLRTASSTSSWLMVLPRRCCANAARSDASPSGL